MKFLFVHSWQGFSLAEWYLREAIANHCEIETHFESLDVPSHGIPANDCLQRLIFSWDPEIIGFSCHYWSIEFFLESSVWIKKVKPQSLIVLGGPQVNSIQSAQLILERYQSIDYIIRGPGEEAICALIEGINMGRSLHNIPGLSYRGTEKIAHNEISNIQKWSKNLIFHQGNTRLVEYLFPLNEISYETIKGCYSKCAYCYYPAEKFEILDDTRIFAELSFICNHKVKNLRICDTHFGGTKERAKKLLRHFCKINHGTSIKIYPHLSHIDEEYISLVKESGSQITSIGIQTTNLLALKKINRQDIIHKYDRQLHLVLSAFPDVPADLIIGLPGDNLEGLLKSFQDVLLIGFMNINLFRLMVFPGTDLFNNLSDYYNGESLLSGQGQMICSPNFQIKDQKNISIYIYALEIICWITRNRIFDLSEKERVAKFMHLTNKLDSDQIISIYKSISLLSHCHDENQLKKFSDKIREIFIESDL